MIKVQPMGTNLCNEGGRAVRGGSKTLNSKMGVKCSKQQIPFHIEHEFCCILWYSMTTPFICNVNILYEVWLRNGIHVHTEVKSESGRT